MKRIILLSLLIPFLSLFSQEEYTLSGYIKDKSSGESLIGATISIKDTKFGAVTNAYGFYSLTLPKGKYTATASYIGYEKLEKAIDLSKDIKFNVELVTLDILSDEVLVTAQKANNNVTSIEMSTLELSAQTLTRMPALLGETDVVKSIQLLPGITSVGEGSTGFNVRGGGIDQNLVLLDEAPVYNSSHLFGFFSVFNPDAVKDVKLVKGGIPAEYGGRLSSILDVRLKEGNSRKFNIDGGIGAIFSRLAIEGPIIEDKLSFLVAARRSYVDVLAKPFLDEGLKDSKFYFYDLTAKANWKVDENNTIFTSGYFGRDVFGAGFGFDWGSQTFTTRWNHLFSDKLFSNLTYYYSNYDYKLQFGDDDIDVFKWQANIVTQSVKYDLNYFFSPKNNIDFGVEALYYKFVPGSAVGISDGISVPISLDNQFAGQFAAYIGQELEATDDLSFKYGMRASYYQYLGPGTAYYYGDTTAGLSKPLISEEKFGDYANMAGYLNFEPRFSVKYQLDEESSLKASYNRMAQYVHLVSNTAASSPLDVWTPTTNNIKPELADQVALGYFKNFEKNEWETSVEVYYKKLQNQIEYRNGADLLLNQYLEADFLSGDGRAYGAEFYIKKNSGDLTGWISYTLARTERQVEGINNSDWFPARFDRTHNLSIVAFYDLSKTWSLSANFILSSGTPATFPTNRYEWQGYYIPHNADGSRNNFRIPMTHRLDLSLTYDPEDESGDWWTGKWVFSIYNVYNRKNPYSVYFRNNEDNPIQTEAVRFAVFGSIVPAISYNFNFDVDKLINE